LKSGTALMMKFGTLGQSVAPTTPVSAPIGRRPDTSPAGSPTVTGSPGGTATTPSAMFFVRGLHRGPAVDQSGPRPGAHPGMVWGRRGSRVNVEDQATASQPDRQRHDERGVVERQSQRGHEDRSARPDAEPAENVVPAARADDRRELDFAGETAGRRRPAGAPAWMASWPAWTCSSSTPRDDRAEPERCAPRAPGGRERHRVREGI